MSQGGRLRTDRRPLVQFGWIKEDLKGPDFWLFDAMKRGFPNVWRVESDSSLGGKSVAEMSLPKPFNKGTAKFEGKIDFAITEELKRNVYAYPGEEKYARSGYAVMYFEEFLDLDGTTAFILRLRSSEMRKWYLNITTHSYFDSETGSLYQFPFETAGGNKWEEHRIPYANFMQSTFGMLSGQFVHPNIKDIISMGIMTKGPSGEFDLEVEKIDVTRDPAEDMFLRTNSPTTSVHPFAPDEQLSFPHHNVLRYREHTRDEDVIYGKRMDALESPFAWAPKRISQIEGARKRLGLEQLLDKELWEYAGYEKPELVEPLWHDHTMRDEEGDIWMDLRSPDLGDFAPKARDEMTKKPGAGVAQNAADKDPVHGQGENTSLRRSEVKLLSAGSSSNLPILDGKAGEETTRD
mmetsp:Transcript_2991/g.14119  ORF Transcript_2991/g.14119 Transcript_2991/m.14119 type:complete len:407 (+) Transcript_2991:420-1640(+)